MRGTITLLQYQHGIIRQVTDVLAGMTRGDSFAKHRKQVARISEFMESYVASFHLSVEERFLFKEATGLSAELARGAKDLRAEHERVKALVSRFKQLSGRKEAYDDGTLAVVAKQLVESITRHLLREEETYFPRIEEALSMERDAEMLREIERYTASKFGSDYLRQFEDKAVRIQDEVLGPGHYQGVQ